MAHNKPTEEEIENVISRVSSVIDEGGSIFPGMSYEEGVKMALEWATGQTDEHPLDD